MTDAGWTADKPTKEGWYWWRLDDGQLQVVYVSKYGTVTISGVGKRSLKRLNGEWLGPITPDTFQQGRVAGLREAQWPNVIAPATYEKSHPGWEDARISDLARIWQLAREVGYAVGLHGSLKRDMDLIAAPWTNAAVGNAALVDHLCAGLSATRIGGPERKPHGRVAVTLQIDGYFKPIDLSIAPRIDVQIEQAAQGEG